MRFLGEPAAEMSSSRDPELEASQTAQPRTVAVQIRRAVPYYTLTSCATTSGAQVG